ncbi:hypothetical protein OAG_04135 [Vibrio cyclitrophicus FF75]|nr:hypothetical protein OAG_04135 [Vibrio cyclitrophicus FF75]
MMRSALERCVGKNISLAYPLRVRKKHTGGVPEWPKGADCKSAGTGADCKSAGTAFDGSNPSPSTIFSLIGKSKSQLIELAFFVSELYIFLNASF